MEYLQEAAGKYLGSEDRPSAGGMGGGLDWDHLSRLTDQYSYLDKNKDGQIDAKDFMGFFGYGGSKPSEAIQAQAGQAPAGYPAKKADTDVVNQLLNKFQKEHGEQFSGSSGQYEALAGLASKLTGKNIPVPILKQLVKWKLGGGL